MELYSNSCAKRETIMGRKPIGTLIQLLTMPQDAKPSWSLACKLELVTLCFDNNSSKFAKSSCAPNKKSRT